MAEHDDLRTIPDDQPKPQIEQQELLPDRNEELMRDKEVEDTCLKLYGEIEKGFSDQWERSNSQMDYWDIYNCELGPKQFYSGNSKIFVPIVADAVDARKTRFTNQIFPMTGKNVEVISSEDKPQALMSLLEFYIRKCRLRSVVVPALMKNGDIEGQYNVMLDWVENRRHVAWRVMRPNTLEGEPGLELMDENDSFEDIEEEEIVHSYPRVEVLPDADVLILPSTCSTSEEAIDIGGSVTILRRYTKVRLQEMIHDGEIDEEKGEALLEQFRSKQPSQNPDKKYKITDSAGIKSEGQKAVAFVYETWTKLAIKNAEGSYERRLCRIRFANEDTVLSCRRNPYWCDQVPIISAPADRTEGSAKGRSRIKRIETLQYFANDAANEGADSAAYALLPIVMTDPIKNPRTGSMTLNVAAIWETDPNATKFANFPPLWKDSFEIVNACKQQIFQSLGVNPSMLPSAGQTKGGKTNQAQVSQEQQVDLLMTADAVIGISDDILTPILRWFVYLDHQFRDRTMTVRQYGVLGHEANMEEIPPVQMDRRFEVRWFGVEAMRSIQQMQMQMAGLNVIRGIPPQQYPGYELNLAPVLSQFVENLFGPRLARQVFTDTRARLSLDPQFENDLLSQGFHVPVNQMDQDQEHMQAHQQLMQQQGDPSGVIREHLLFHMMNVQKKAQQQQMQQQAQQQGAQGVPGGAGPGVPGTPRQGARTAGPRGGQGPPGMIHPDQMRGAGVAPRQRMPMAGVQ
jgi:hypothetical protein